MFYTKSFDVRTLMMIPHGQIPAGAFNALI